MTATSLVYDRKGRRKYLTVSERAAFIESTATMPPHVHTFCLVLAYTGARISEALALRPSEVDLEAQLIVFESLKKRRRGVFRAVPVPRDLLDKIERIHSIRGANLNTPESAARIWPWCRTTAWAFVSKGMADAGIRGPQATPKGLRHAFAVGALQAGIPINLLKKWLGHSRLSTTEIYADVIGEEERAIAQNLWEKFWPQAKGELGSN